MKISFKIVAAMVTAVFLTGCTMTPEECDPRHDVNVFNKLGCAVSGSYSKRVEMKKEKVDEAIAQRKALAAKMQEIENNRAELIKNRGERIMVLDDYKARLADLRAELEKKNQLNASLKQKLDELEKKAEAAKDPDNSKSTMEKNQLLNELQQEEDELLDAFSDADLD